MLRPIIIIEAHFIVIWICPIPASRLRIGPVLSFSSLVTCEQLIVLYMLSLLRSSPSNVKIPRSCLSLLDHTICAFICLIGTCRPYMGINLLAFARLSLYPYLSFFVLFMAMAPKVKHSLTQPLSPFLPLSLNQPIIVVRGTSCI